MTRALVTPGSRARSNLAGALRLLLQLLQQHAGRGREVLRADTGGVVDRVRDGGARASADAATAAAATRFRHVPFIAVSLSEQFEFVRDA